MAEVQLAQRLADNDRRTRNKTLKSLARYLTARSSSPTGFSSDDLLKIWKGLFYCLWMQDKPLLQEELSSRISTLLHSFSSTQSQLLYFNTFLLTMKREWNGIDRLRMDKFFQLVRFMFRQGFEVLKRRGWESSVVNAFLEILSAQLLHKSACVPPGLRMHVLDLYMSELARVGSAELTAEQNLTFIDPFCKALAECKDHAVLVAISKNIFGTIVDQAAYAVEDLMKELLSAGGGDSDSGQASEEEEEEEEELKKSSSREAEARMSSKEDEASEEELEEENVREEVDDIGPVLQFDYSALAERLFALGSHMKVNSSNRSKIYRLVKTFRDLNQGIFPQDADEDHDLICSSSDDDDENFSKEKKKKKKKKQRRGEQEEEEEEQEEESSGYMGRAGGEDAEEDSELHPSSNGTESARKKKKKKRAGGETEAEVAPPSGETVECGETPEPAHVTEDGEKRDETGKKGRKRRKEEKEGDSGKAADEEGKDEAEPHEEAETLNSTSSTRKNKRKRRRRSEAPQRAECTEGSVEELAAETGGASASPPSSSLLTPHTQENQITAAPTAGGRKKKRNRRKNMEKGGSMEALAAEEMPVQDTAAAPRNKKSKKVKEQSGEVEVNKQLLSQVPLPKPGKKKQTAEEQDEKEEQCEDTHGNAPAAKKKSTKRHSTPTLTSDLLQETERPSPPSEKKKQKDEREVADAGKKRRKQIEEDEAAVSKTSRVETDGGQPTPISTGRKKKKRKMEREEEEVHQINGVVQVEEGEAAAASVSTPVSLGKKLKKKKLSTGSDFIRFQSPKTPPTALYCSKKVLTPKSEGKKVTFGLKNNRTAEFRKTDQSQLVSPVGPARVAFDPQKKPRSGVLKSPASSSSAQRRATAADFF